MAQHSIHSQSHELQGARRAPHEEDFESLPVPVVIQGAILPSGPLEIWVQGLVKMYQVIRDKSFLLYICDPPPFRKDSPCDQATKGRGVRFRRGRPIAAVFVESEGRPVAHPVVTPAPQGHRFDGPTNFWKMDAQKVRRFH